MKSNYFFGLSFIFLFFSVEAIFAQMTIAKWDFNGSSATTIPGGAASPAVAEGIGTAMLVGGITASFSSGTSEGGSTDTSAKSSENFGWHTRSYATSGAENKGRGIQFNINTTGYEDLILTFDQRLSNTASNTYVVQYSVDISAISPVWQDVQTLTITPASDAGNLWYNSRTVDLSSISDLNNNPNVGIRIVSAFDPTASNYVAVTSTSSYGATGTVRYDMVVFTASSQSLSLQKRNDSMFSFYPNPVNGDFINFGRMMNVSVYDSLGKIVIYENEGEKLDISRLSHGLYFVRNDEGGVVKMYKN